MKYKIYIYCIFFILVRLLNAQVGINTSDPHPDSDLHLASPNKTLILNYVDDFDKIKNPLKGMIVYDDINDCFKGFTTKGWTDCFGSSSTTMQQNLPVIEVTGPGFVGNFFSKTPLTDQTFEVTITNNSFSEAKIGFSVDDLSFSNDQIRATNLYYRDPTNPQNLLSTPTGGLNLISGAQVRLVFKLQGTLSKPTPLTGNWKKLTLEYTDEIDFKYQLDCSTGSWSTPISPLANMGLQHGVFYSGVYTIPYTDADDIIFEAENYTIDGLTLKRNRTVGTSSGQLVYNLSGTYTGESGNTISFQTYYGCGIRVGEYPKNCLEVKSYSNISGVYKIDPDGEGGLSPFEAYCDMVTDGGGWTLILNYQHKATTNPELVVLNDKLPLLGTISLGTDESGSKYWGHAGVALVSKLEFNEIRFYGITSSHDVMIHFKTDLISGKKYLQTGSGSFTMDLKTNHTLLPGHTSQYLPQQISGTYSGYGDYALTEFPFWKTGGPNWSIRTANSKSIKNRWEVEDYFYTTSTNENSPSTHHQVWVR